MNVCSFTFTSLRTKLPCRVTDVERTWEYLTQEFDRHSEGLPNARYFETMGAGPQLFAVVNERVYYHHEENWCVYHSAVDILHETMAVDDAAFVLDEMNDHRCMLYERLAIGRSKNNRVLMSRTNLCMPRFIDNSIELRHRGYSHWSMRNAGEGISNGQFEIKRNSFALIKNNISWK